MIALVRSLIRDSIASGSIVCSSVTSANTGSAPACIIQNDDAINEAGKNSGSCKLFSFAQINQLTKQQTLNCFGNYYKDVLNTPEGNDHQNIRNFMKTGWEGIVFEGEALSKKK